MMRQIICRLEEAFAPVFVAVAGVSSALALFAWAFPLMLGDMSAGAVARAYDMAVIFGMVAAVFLWAFLASDVVCSNSLIQRVGVLRWLLFGGMLGSAPVLFVGFVGLRCRVTSVGEPVVSFWSFLAEFILPLVLALIGLWGLGVEVATPENSPRSAASRG